MVPLTIASANQQLRDHGSRVRLILSNDIFEVKNKLSHLSLRSAELNSVLLWPLKTPQRNVHTKWKDLLWNGGPWGDRTRCIFDLLCPSPFSLDAGPTAWRQPYNNSARSGSVQTRTGWVECVDFLFSPCGETSTDLTNMIHSTHQAAVPAGGLRIEISSGLISCWCALGCHWFPIPWQPLSPGATKPTQLATEQTDLANLTQEEQVRVHSALFVSNFIHSVNQTPSLSISTWANRVSVQDVHQSH